MALNNALEAITRQFDAAERGLKACPPDPGRPGEDWWEESGRRHLEAFSLLAAGEGLPFFRPYHLEISGQLLGFAGEVRSLGEAISSSPPAGPAVGGWLRNAGECLSSLRLAWTRYREDAGRADRELAASLVPLASLRDAVSRLHLPDGSDPLRRRCERAAEALFAIALALEKAIATARI